MRAFTSSCSIFERMGESEGSLCSIGYHEVQDLLGATDYFCRAPGDAGFAVGAYGISMGGAVTLMAAAQEPRLAAVATHGAYASLDRAIDAARAGVFGPAGAALSRPVAYWGKRWFDKDPQRCRPVNVIGQIAPRPVLLMHGAQDIIVNPADAQSLYDAACEPKTLTVWPRSWHVRINAQERPDYEAALVTSFSKT